jgi:hypothetical protein
VIHSLSRTHSRKIGFGLSLLVAALCLLVLLPSVHAQGLSVNGIQSPVEKNSSAKQETPIQIRAERGEAPLNRLYGNIKVEPSKIRRLPLLSERDVKTVESAKRIQIGTVRPFSRSLDILAESAIYRVAEGEVRVMGVVSEGALSTRVHFTKVALPAGARIFVYSLKNPDEFYGPYEGRGPSDDGAFWTPPMEGDGAVIEYFSPQPLTDSQKPPFEVSELSHIFTDPLKAGGNSAAGACNLEVAEPWVDVAKSVGRLDFVENGGSYLCTGTLLNDQASDLAPYLITANHCFSTTSAAQSLRVYWNYLGGNSPFSNTPYTDGAKLLVTGPTSDFTFVRLTGAVPGGLWYAGWQNTKPAAGTAVTGIHHPSGSHKRISFGHIDPLTYCPDEIPGACDNFSKVSWNSGVTEGGSSGSAIFVGASSSDAKYVGNLWGGFSSCSTPSEPDWYGGFDVTFPFIAQYLTDQGRGTCSVTPIAYDQTISGNLNASDCHSRRGSYADQYTFSGAAGEQVSIFMGASFDSYLYLIGPGGTVLSEVDHLTGAPTAFLPSTGYFVLPSSGTYTIEATSHNAGATGSYSLQLSGQQQAPGPHFSQTSYSFGEGDGRAAITVNRVGNTSGALSLRYNTTDGSGLNECSKVTGMASSRCDYTTSYGSLEFAPGETTKAISISLVDDSWPEGNESFTISLSDGGSGPFLGNVGKATVTISDNDGPATANPMDQTAFFVRQHYIDFLGREPDSFGFKGWQDILNNCAAGDTKCDRIEVSAGFFRSPEFQERGYFIYRFYAASLGKIPNYSSFIPSMAQVSGFLTTEQLEARKVAFASDFMQNLDFMRMYTGTDARGFVELLLSTAGVSLPNKEQLISDLSAGKKTRAEVLRAVVESAEVYSKFYNESFVVMQYFGYLRRDPDSLYKDWIKIMNQNGGDYRAMINGFVNSLEYRQRFGP